MQIVSGRRKWRFVDVGRLDATAVGLGRDIGIVIVEAHCFHE